MKNVLSVYQVTNYIASVMEEDVILSEIFIEGEISNFKNSKHLYFTLKDDYATINCIMFKTEADKLKFKLENGIKVIVFGRIGVYEKMGRYQVYVSLIRPCGIGLLHSSYENLKQTLQDEGIFDDYHKKKLPKNPDTIALVTSLTGAVIQDMIRIARRRNPSVNIIVVPTYVQGQGAPLEIVQALTNLAQYGKVDVAILARGGGSLEELWAFNEEIVARAIFRFPLPIISAIGHETDFTIADLVADVRASTPSSAIEICLPNKNEQKEILVVKTQMLINLLNLLLINNKNKLNKISSKPVLQDASLIVSNRKIYAQSLYKNLITQFQINHMLYVQNFKLITSSLKNLSPFAILEKGYTIIYKDNKTLKTSKTLNKGDTIDIQFNDSTIKAEIL